MTTDLTRREALGRMGRLLGCGVGVKLNLGLGLGLSVQTLGTAPACANLASEAERRLPKQLPEALEQLGLRPLGRGTLRLWGFKVYEAELLLSGGPARAEVLDRLLQEPFALRIFYARSISQSQLIARTADEIRRLGLADENRLTQWSEQLARLWPSVQDGDEITGLHQPGRGAAFYVRQQLTGEIADPRFSEAFFRIWLDPQTTSPSLRRALLRLP